MAVPEKTVWKGGTKKGWTFYCPQCSAVRKIPISPKPIAWINAFRVLLTTGVITLATWTWFQWKGLVAFIPLWAAFETYYRLKLRTSVSCPNCGFDPYLFLTDAKKARTEMETFWKAKFAERGIPFPGSDKKPAQPALPHETVKTEAKTKANPKNPG